LKGQNVESKTRNTADFGSLICTTIKIVNKLEKI